MSEEELDNPVVRRSHIGRDAGFHVRARTAKPRAMLFADQKLLRPATGLALGDWQLQVPPWRETIPAKNPDDSDFARYAKRLWSLPPRAAA